MHDFRQCFNVICNIFAGLVSCFPPYYNQRTKRLTCQYHQKWKYTTVSSFVPSEFFNLSEISRINSRAISLLGSSTRTEYKTWRQHGNRKAENTLKFIISSNDEYEFENLMVVFISHCVLMKVRNTEASLMTIWDSLFTFFAILLCFLMFSLHDWNKEKCRVM